MEEGNPFEYNCFDRDICRPGSDPYGEAYEAGIL